MIKTCGSCVLRAESGACKLFKANVPATQSACIAHKYKKYDCDICGNIATTYNLNEENEWNFYCDSCTQALSTCGTCSNRNICPFEQDTSISLPKMVTKVIRQGSSQIQTQVPNAERIDKTCKAKCKCFNSENGCCKQINYCSSWTR